MTVRPSQLITMSGSFVDNVQLLDETIQHNLLLGMRPKSTHHHQKFDPGKVSQLYTMYMYNTLDTVQLYLTWMLEYGDVYRYNL
jgi:hypothetical protein